MTARLLLVYDGECGFCRRCIRYLRERDLAGAIEAVPNQAPGIGDLAGLTPEEMERSVWTVEEDRTTRHGAAAFNTALRALGGPWWVAGTVGTLPGLSALEQLAYEWVAAHRPLVSRLASDPPETHQ